MRVTIIRDDGIVGIDGTFRAVDLSGLDENVRAVQWDGDAGHVEYDHSANTSLDNMNAYQAFIDLWTAAAPAAPSAPTLEQIKAAARARIDMYYDAAVASLGFSKSEMQSWPIQDAEARAYLLDPDAATPWLKGAASARGMSVEALATLISRRTGVVTRQYGEITGKLKVLRDRIDALPEGSTQADADAIQW